MSGAFIQFIVENQTQLWSLATVIFAALVGRIFRLRPKLFYSVDHSTNIVVDQPLLNPEGQQIAPVQLVRTASITVQNTGLHPAKNVEVAFNWKPPIMNILPARAFSEVHSAINRYSLKFESFAPGERSTIEIMSINADLPFMTSVRADDCVGRSIPMAPQRVWPQWFLNLIALVMLLGAATGVYLLISLVQLIAD